MECETISVRETARRLGISPALAYQAARRRELPVIRIGKRYLVLRAQLEGMLAGAGKGAEVTGGEASMSGEVYEGA
jgi:excisionase family DNA binding protein